MRARATKDRLAEMILAGPLSIAGYRLDRCGRTIARVTAGSTDLGAAMIA